MRAFAPKASGSAGTERGGRALAATEALEFSLFFFFSFSGGSSWAAWACAFSFLGLGGGFAIVRGMCWSWRESW